jgi:Tfp pilus assembly protein PilO
MPRLTKEKRDRLIMIGVVALVVCLGIWYLMIRTSKATLKENQQQKAKLLENIRMANLRVKELPRYQEQLTNLQERLGAIEKEMLPVGRELTALNAHIEQVRARHKVQFKSEVSPPFHSTVELLPEFPYGSASFGCTFYGGYHDFGKFLADLENTYTNMQFLITSIQPTKQPEQRAVGEEDLRFDLRIVALVQQPAPR